MKVNREDEEAVVFEARAVVAEIDVLVRYDMLQEELQKRDWTVTSDRGEDSPVAPLEAYKGDANITAPLHDVTKRIVISRDADADETPAWAVFCDQETPIPVLLALAEMVATGALHNNA